jgi:hypothetical protein
MLIRVAAPEQSREPVVGTLIECSADTIVLAQAKHGRRVTFRPDGITRIDSMVGCSGPSWGVGAAWAVLGAVQGVIAGAVVRREEWTNTPLDHVRVSALVAGRGRVGAAVTIGF